jgi:hypothetical protein
MNELSLRSGDGRFQGQRGGERVGGGTSREEDTMGGRPGVLQPRLLLFVLRDTFLQLQLKEEQYNSAGPATADSKQNGRRGSQRPRKGGADGEGRGERSEVVRRCL